MYPALQTHHIIQFPTNPRGKGHGPPISEMGRVRRKELTCRVGLWIQVSQTLHSGSKRSHTAPASTYGITVSRCARIFSFVVQRVTSLISSPHNEGSSDLLNLALQLGNPTRAALLWELALWRGSAGRGTGLHSVRQLIPHSPQLPGGFCPQEMTAVKERKGRPRRT